MSQMPAPLVITPGEPSGIGAEITLKAWQAGVSDICLMGAPEHIVQTAQSLGIELNFMKLLTPHSMTPTRLN